MSSTYEIVNDFKTAMCEAGIEPPDVIQADGVLHRFHVNGHKAGSLNGAYKLHLDGAKPAGYFEDFKAGVKVIWKADGPSRPLTQAERAELEAQKRRNEERRAAKQERAAMVASRLWAAAKTIKGRAHPYLARKQVDGYELRVLPVWSKRIRDGDDWRDIYVHDALLIPLTDTAGRLWNLQAIFAEPHPLLARDKDFLNGGRLAGVFYRIGPETADKNLCEGAATGLTLFESTDRQTFCAMSANNLLPVAQALCEAYPAGNLTICADNDEKTPGNPGVTAARAAALAVDACLAVPPICGDFNDYGALLRQGGGHGE